jgi:hypothetical protein
MADLSIILSEIQSMRREMSREQQELRAEFRREQQELADQFTGLINNFTILGDNLHASFQTWAEQSKGIVVEHVLTTLTPSFEALMVQISQIRSCDW